MDTSHAPDALAADDTVAVRLRYALTLRGAFAHRVSLAAGLARGTARWILDHPAESPRASTVAALARELAVDPAWLAFGHPYSAPIAEVPAADRASAAEVPAEINELVTAAPIAEVEPAAEVPAAAPPADLDPDAVRARWRATTGANQHAAARASGLSQSTLSRFLAGKRGTPAAARAVAAYLDALAP